MSTFQEVTFPGSCLDADQRLRLAHAIWEDLPPEESPLPDPEWIAEAQRRSAEYDAGRMKASPWSNVRTRARKKTGLDE